MNKVRIILSFVIMLIVVVFLMVSNNSKNEYEILENIDFEKKIDVTKDTVLVYFFKKECLACNRLGVNLNAALKENKVDTYAIDTEKMSEEMKAKYNITKTPTLLIFQDNKVISRVEEVISSNEISEFIKKNNL